MEIFSRPIKNRFAVPGRSKESLCIRRKTQLLGRVWKFGEMCQGGRLKLSKANRAGRWKISGESLLNRFTALVLITVKSSVDG